MGLRMFGLMVIVVSRFCLLSLLLPVLLVSMLLLLLLLLLVLVLVLLLLLSWYFCFVMW